MFQKYVENIYFCGYEYLWKCTNWDGKEFEVTTKDRWYHRTGLEYDRLSWIDSEHHDSEDFMKYYVQLEGGVKIKIRELRLVEKKSFKLHVDSLQRRKWFGKAKNINTFFGPCSEEFEEFVS